MTPKPSKRKRLLSDISTPPTTKKNPVGRPHNSQNTKEKGLKNAHKLFRDTFFTFKTDSEDGIEYGHCRTQKCVELAKQTMKKNRPKGRLKVSSAGHYGKS